MYTKGERERHNRLYDTEVTEHIWCGDKHIADFDGEDATANTKLCLAAPELYEELKKADDLICHLCKICMEATLDCFSCDDRELRLKALAKAEGK